MHVRILNINVMRLPGNLPKITYRSVLPDYRYVLPWLLSSSTWCPWLLTSVTRLPSLCGDRHYQSTNSSPSAQ